MKDEDTHAHKHADVIFWRSHTHRHTHTQRRQTKGVRGPLASLAFDVVQGDVDDEEAMPAERQCYTHTTHTHTTHTTHSHNTHNTHTHAHTQATYSRTVVCAGFSCSPKAMP